VSFSPEHPADWTLELLVEGELLPDERTRVAAHVEGCARCAVEVEAYRTLFATMSSLPRFSPASDFSDAVMARVTIAHTTAMPDWLTAWLPKTQRGWMMLVGLSMAPALPLIALVWWVVSNPMVSLTPLWQQGSTWALDTAWALLVAVLGTAVESQLIAWGQLLMDRLMETPVTILVLGTLIFAVGIPVSVWTLYRTLRTPSKGTTTYAH
jgi:anti-sigma factor RsiW